MLPITESRAAISLATRAHPLALLFLMERSRLAASLVGGLPITGSSCGIRDVLDVACGPGSWALDIVKPSPAGQEGSHKRVIGIDPARSMVKFARAEARVRGLPSASFLEVDRLSPLPFADGVFDFVHGGFLSDLVPPAGWPHLLREFWRVLRPGGMLQLLEFEQLEASAPAFATFCALLRQRLSRALDADPAAQSGEGLTAGVEEAGFLARGRSFRWECSYGSDLSVHIADLLLLQLDLLTGELIASGLATAEMLSALARHMTLQKHLPRFEAVISITQVFGHKTGAPGAWTGSPAL
jgi:SAM-dependent methyltransferase